MDRRPAIKHIPAYETLMVRFLNKTNTNMKQNKNLNLRFEKDTYTDKINGVCSDAGMILFVCVESSFPMLNVKTFTIITHLAEGDVK